MAGDRFTVDPGLRTLLHDLGLPAGQVLRRAGLPTDLFRGGPVELPAEEYFRLWDALDAESGQPNLAVAIGQAISVEIFSPPIFAALCSPNLEAAARRIAAYKPLIGPLAVAITSDAAGLTVHYRWPAQISPPQILAITELVFWVALAGIGTRHQVRPVQVTARRPPADPKAITEYFGTHVSKGATESITFAREDAIRPFITENESMWKFFEPNLRQRLADLQSTASVAVRVRAALLETLPAGDPTVQSVARRLSSSPRTLQRQLQLEGTSFQAVLAATREWVARYCLTHSPMTTGEIAYLLAYEDTNSFYRAFRSWTGASPDSVRASAGRADRRTGKLAANSSAFLHAPAGNARRPARKSKYAGGP